ncbi:hypothetical protein [Winogradskyella helgolandensis]|nr:hypothetical protein [Winogradskyella helgolandensis]
MTTIATEKQPKSNRKATEKQPKSNRKATEKGVFSNQENSLINYFRY